MSLKFQKAFTQKNDIQSWILREYDSLCSIENSQNTGLGIIFGRKKMTADFPLILLALYIALLIYKIHFHMWIEQLHIMIWTYIIWSILKWEEYSRHTKWFLYYSFTFCLSRLYNHKKWVLAWSQDEQNAEQISVKDQKVKESYSSHFLLNWTSTRWNKHWSTHIQDGDVQLAIIANKPRDLSERWLHSEDVQIFKYQGT